jgi:hypothetical protein
MPSPYSSITWQQISQVKKVSVIKTKPHYKLVGRTMFPVILLLPLTSLPEEYLLTFAPYAACYPYYKCYSSHSIKCFSNKKGTDKATLLTGHTSYIPLWIRHWV